MNRVPFLLLFIAALSIIGTVWGQAPQAQSREMIPRALLVDMARQQYSVLCQSEVFAQCMGFDTQQCLSLSEAAIRQCLLPLPEQINPEELDNSSLESCPTRLFAEAGFTEEMAGDCYDEAMKP